MHQFAQWLNELAHWRNPLGISRDTTTGQAKPQTFNYADPESSARISTWPSARTTAPPMAWRPPAM